MSTGIAILGAGIFARDEHLPAVQACSLLSLKAIYSRSEESADKLAQDAANLVDTYFDSPCTSGRSLDDLLKRDDVDAVTIALPILLQPEVIKKALRAEKHVLSEKPIAKDVDTATEMVRWYEDTRQEQIWSVGENFRFLDSVAFGAEQIRRLGGNVVAFGLRVYGFIDENEKYYQTEWRQTPKYQGGFLLDGGIHFVSGLRYLLAAAGQFIIQVTAFTSLLQPHLAPLDTINAIVKVENENSGQFCLSFGAEFKTDFEIQVVTDRGAVTVLPTEVAVLTKDAGGERTERRGRVRPGSAVKVEVAAFAESIRTGKSDPRGTPEQALADLQVLQAMLESGEEAGAVKEVQSAT
ncbi:hypothetical protein ABVK25_007688 [Lepraria finkii]|uniref:NAD(P)-binding protein n=1 Tax=Lepraria finkii TaxID=1340010 RepID=A0ABR4B4P7_9LECA